MRSIEDIIGYRFRDSAVLRQALTHTSYSAEHRASGDNERLEFLGDSVLGLVTAHYVYAAAPDHAEGQLAKIKARLVSKPYLCEWAKEIRLGGYLRLGQGELSSGGSERASNLANALEALIGAVYLDGGFAAAETFVKSWLARQRLDSDGADYKSALQEILQKKHKVPPDYEVAHTVGPEHDKTFTVNVLLGDKILGRGKGKNKKDAEQAAAQDALSRLGGA